METMLLSKIFIVDDDIFCREMYAHHIKNLGYTDIVSFDNGQDCINHLTEEPDIILLDHRMEPLDGIELLKKIKRFNPDIYIVLISGQEDMQVAINALKYGAFDYIIKGGNDVEMITAILKKIANVMELVKETKPRGLSKVLSYLNFL
jgi:DNA-binding NtrC family response regulator